MKKVILSLILICNFVSVWSQDLHFAHVTDIHVGASTGTEDLRLTIEDINNHINLDFVIVSGDITEFGSYDELYEAKKLLNNLKIPWYVIPGNHDSKWSESGCNDFVRVFGDEKFSFVKNGFLFIGTASGPNMRMAPGLVPREHLIYLEEVLDKHKSEGLTVINVNHYPLDQSLSNYNEVLSILRKGKTSVTLLGHGHSNKLYNFSGLPGVMSRSNLKDKNKPAGYNIVTINQDTMYYKERWSGIQTKPVWCKIPLTAEISEVITKEDSIKLYNRVYPNIITKWKIREESDIGSGISIAGKKAVYSNTKGEVVCINANSGKTLWKFKTQGKIYSTPAIKGNRVVCPSTDGNIYCINLKNGTVLWKIKTNKPIVASSTIEDNLVFLGSSEGKFSAIDLLKGEIVWQFDGVENFIETKPLVYEGKVYFGSWGNAFYCLNKNTGKLIWERKKYTNRMLSPAAVWPVGANGKVFIVAPDRRLTALDAETGKEIWDTDLYSCRESIGISIDKKELYIKNMTGGQLIALNAQKPNPEMLWKCDVGLGYEISPTPVIEYGNIVFIATDKGIIHAVDKVTHKVIWRQKISEALITGIAPYKKNTLIASSMDGHLVCLKY